jgi:hypothetical protein
MTKLSEALPRPGRPVVTLGQLEVAITQRFINKLRIEVDGGEWFVAGGVRVATGSSLAEALENLFAKV